MGYIFIYIGGLMGNIYISQKIAICSLCTVCPCLSFFVVDHAREQLVVFPILSFLGMGKKI